jgi:hypothetical protein
MRHMHFESKYLIARKCGLEVLPALFGTGCSAVGPAPGRPRGREEKGVASISCVPTQCGEPKPPFRKGALRVNQHPANRHRVTFACPRGSMGVSKRIEITSSLADGIGCAAQRVP